MPKRIYKSNQLCHQIEKQLVHLHLKHGSKRQYVLQMHTRNGKQDWETHSSSSLIWGVRATGSETTNCSSEPWSIQTTLNTDSNLGAFHYDDKLWVYCKAFKFINDSDRNAIRIKKFAVTGENRICNHHQESTGTIATSDMMAHRKTLWF